MATGGRRPKRAVRTKKRHVGSEPGVELDKCVEIARWMWRRKLRRRLWRPRGAKKTTCAEIVLKVAAIQGGEKRHVLKLRNRWRRHRKRKKRHVAKLRRGRWRPRGAKTKKCAKFSQGLWRPGGGGRTATKLRNACGDSGRGGGMFKLRRGLWRPRGANK